ncbi:hypothetical protein Y592_03525 [Thermosipho sp. 1070]|nr:hypothetical protein Y592_03525 [Thermosipho sp. 1070]
MKILKIKEMIFANKCFILYKERVTKNSSKHINGKNKNQTT